MPNIAVVDMAGKSVGEITLSDAVFGIKPNAADYARGGCKLPCKSASGHAVHSDSYRGIGRRQKPWRQKGTGHARQGSTRAPQWRHGGIVHAPKPRDYSYSLNKKVKRLALKSALSDKVLTGDMIVLDELKTETYKTKVVADCLKAIGAGKKTLIVLEDNNAFAVKSIANIAGAKSAQVGTINTYDIINADTLVVVKNAVAKLEEVYA